MYQRVFNFKMKWSARKGGIIFGGVQMYSDKNHDEPDKAIRSFWN